MSHIPDHDELEQLLSNIQVQPSKNLDKRLANAPWKQEGDDKFSVWLKRANQHYAKIAAIFLIFMLGLLVVSPSVRTTAQQIVSWFFTPAISNTQSNTVIQAQSTATIPPEVLQAILQTSEDAEAILATIRQEADFDFSLPQYIPSSYRLADAYTFENSVILSYEIRGTDPLSRHITLQITQGDPIANYTIGQNASVEQLIVDGRIFEYLQGAWDTVRSTQEGDLITIDSQWNNDVQMHYLVWYDDTHNLQYNMLYQAAYIPHPAYYGDGAPDLTGYLTRDDLMDIALSVP